jgi:glycosyltransferase involved in cell wall biosynthesis
MTLLTHVQLELPTRLRIENEARLKILICMASIDPRRGGPSSAVRELAAALSAAGNSVTVIAHNDESANETSDVIDGYSVLRFALAFAPWQYSRTYRRWLKANVRSFDAVVINSLFLAHTFFASRYSHRASVPYAIRPHGSLNTADLAKNKFLKSLYLALVDRRTLNRAKFLFCTSATEADQALGSTATQALVIPLGISASIAAITRFPNSVDRDLVLFLGRITPKKGVDIFIQAFAKAQQQLPSLRAKIVGPDDENLQDGFNRLASDLGMSDYVDFNGFAGPAERAALLERAGMFVLPSADENFGISVAEALGAGMPVVITPGVSHAGLVKTYRAGYVPNRNVDDVAEAMIKIRRLSDSEYIRMSAQARQLVEDNYSWPASASKLVAGFSQ